MKPSRSRQPAKPSQPRLLAGWQRGLIWILWLGFFGLCIANSDQGELSWKEFAAMCVAGAFTFWCLNHPAGIEKVEIRAPSALRGEFRSRTNWALVLLASALLLVGIAAASKIAYDLHHGLTTVYGVFEDFGLFFLEMVLEQISGGVEGDVTHTKMYILIGLLPVGMLMLWFNLLPWLFCGVAFRVQADGQILVKLGGQWQTLQLKQFGRVTADGITLEFYEAGQQAPRVTLPQGRVYSSELETRVADRVLADYFRQRLTQAGFQTVTQSSDPSPTSWECVRDGDASRGSQ